MQSTITTLDAVTESMLSQFSTTTAMDLIVTHMRATTGTTAMDVIVTRTSYMVPDHGGRCHCNTHAHHNLGQYCRYVCDTHRVHDEIGKNAIRHVESDFADYKSPTAVHHVYVHEQPGFHNHHNHHSVSHAIPVIQHSRCRIWQDDGCVQYLNRYSDRTTHIHENIKPPAVHVYGNLHQGLLHPAFRTHADDIPVRTGVPSNSSERYMYSSGIPVVATAPPKNPAPVDGEDNDFIPLHLPIASTQEDVFPVQAHKDPMEAQLECFEPTDADILLQKQMMTIPI